ncbi:S10 family peptidase [Aquisphaera insulae]|uniref:S10 family peptidase n=1 Tax=Aquisphaera insulae TaxID=2712864 RepID=UPI0013EDEDF8|nr:peptidase S10 [Aquisphaera insulae]
MTRILSAFATLTMVLTLAALQTSPSRAQEPSPKAEEKPKKKDSPKAEEKPKDKEKEKKDAGKSSTDEEPVVTHHAVTVGGKELKYTATVGLMPIRDAKGETEARIFFMAYHLDEPKASSPRPVLFSFNGGPGSASVWLHIGALGPRLVPAPQGPTIPAPPFRVVDNPATWLDRTDMVFIDPVGTGYSRAAKPELNQKFHSLKGDIESVGEFVRMYLTRFDRWDSPLYVIGESYGTTRAAGLAGHLVEKGIAFNGIILVSCALDYQGFVFNTGNDLPFLNYLPSYAATAWYHKKLPADLQAGGLPAVLKEAEAFVDREYAAVLARGDRLTDEEKQRVAAGLARLTGLDATTIADHQLRLELDVFRKELLKAKHRSVGRFDSRYEGIENLSPSSSGEPATDPSYSAVRASYTSAFNRYIRTELGYKTDVPYYILGEGVGRWDFDVRMGYPSTTGPLSEALTKNPHMKVLIASGYYDLATPYRAVDHALARLGLDPAIRGNISTTTYEAGHMMYLHGPSLHKLKADGAAFLDGSHAP